jgi:hypothetical protein
MPCYRDSFTFNFFSVKELRLTTILLGLCVSLLYWMLIINHGLVALLFRSTQWHIRLCLIAFIQNSGSETEMESLRQSRDFVMELPKSKLIHTHSASSKSLKELKYNELE